MEGEFEDNEHPREAMVAVYKGPGKRVLEIYYKDEETLEKYTDYYKPENKESVPEPLETVLNRLRLTRVETYTAGGVLKAKAYTNKDGVYLCLIPAHFYRYTLIEALKPTE